MTRAPTDDRPGDEVEQPHLLSVREVAEKLGVHESTIRRRISQGSLPIIKIGSTIRIAPGDLDRWLRTQRVIRVWKDSGYRFEQFARKGHEAGLW